MGELTGGQKATMKRYFEGFKDFLDTEKGRQWKNLRSGGHCSAGHNKISGVIGVLQNIGSR